MAHVDLDDEERNPHGIVETEYGREYEYPHIFFFLCCPLGSSYYHQNVITTPPLLVVSAWCS